MSIITATSMPRFTSRSSTARPPSWPYAGAVQPLEHRTACRLGARQLRTASATVATAASVRRMTLAAAKNQARCY
jgi:hypothetical protein